MSGADNAQSTGPTREELDELARMVRKSIRSQDDAAVMTYLEAIEGNIGAIEIDGDHGIPPLASLLLNLVSTSGIPRDLKRELSEKAAVLWKGCKLDMNDFEFCRKSNGDRKCIGKGGAADIYLARMKLRDEYGNIINVKHVEVAAKVFTISRADFQDKFPQFIRELYIQKKVQHPCILRIIGGYWPSPEEVDEDDEDEDVFEPIIVMERMSCDLSHALYGFGFTDELLTSVKSKLGVLTDVAEGIKHLHENGVVHRDIKPQNVLLRLSDGQIIGRAKLCDVGISRTAEETLPASIDALSKPMGSVHYMAPETFSSSVEKSNRRARDIWSFGVLICEVLLPDFLRNIVRNVPEREEVFFNGRFAQDVATTVRTMEWDGRLRDIAVSCLSLDPEARPRIDDVFNQLKIEYSSPSDLNLPQPVDEPAEQQEPGFDENDQKFQQLLDTLSKTVSDLSDKHAEDNLVFDKEDTKVWQLLDTLSKNTVPMNMKLKLSEIVLKAWKGWKVVLEDIEYERRSSGTRKILGKGSFGRVYRARLQLRDSKNNVIAGERAEVAVKELLVKAWEVEQKFFLFVRELLLQKYAEHPCIVRIFNAYWPAPGEFYEEAEGDEEKYAEAVIVMERMSHRLSDVLKLKLLTPNSKRRVLADIAEAIEHLHHRKISHRDLKPDNIMTRVVNGQIIGRAKLCDFGISITGEETLMRRRTRGTSVYEPPEMWDTSPHAHDIWSYGVLMCQVLDPDFLSKIRANDGHFARKVAERAKEIQCEQVLKDLIASCLSLDPSQRPSAKEIRVQIENGLRYYRFTFEPYYSLEYKAKEVLRYVRKYLNVEIQKNNIAAAVDALKQTSSDLSAKSALAYCHYHGIGMERNTKKAIEMFENGCVHGDFIAMCSRGAVHYGAERFKEAASLFTKASGLGSQVATFLLAQCYRWGHGVEKDEEKAFHLTLSASKAGFEDATATLATYYIFGIGIEEDKQKGVDMLRALTASNNVEAIRSLSFLYKEGLGVQKNEVLANILDERAQEQGIVAPSQHQNQNSSEPNPFQHPQNVLNAESSLWASFDT